jgi:hypothetical protein
VRATKSKNSTILYVTFSEPVDLAQVDGANFVRISGQSASLCILRGDKCADPKEQFISLDAHVRLSVPFSPEDVDIVLGGAVMGSGRTVAEGAAAANLPITNGALVVKITENSWESCENDQTYCWTETRSLPAP